VPEPFALRPIGVVRSPLTDRAAAPKQGWEGSPEAWIAFDDDLLPALASVEVGDELLVLTWFHAADRSVLAVHPRGNPDNPVTGVFSTRSPDRPNPIGLHPVRVLEVDGARVRVADLEAIDGTPVVDVKSLGAGPGPK
jgi:tRNA-Thr(GGU) m(6)t(6)A37 methyltransferase TsaA